jgi:predicted nucleic acid-binding protein
MSTPLVIDASFTLKLLLPNPEQARCRELMADWAQNEEDLYAPTLWLYEVVSALTKAVYFELLTEAEGQQALHLAQTFDIQ